MPWARTSAFAIAGLAGGFIVLGLLGARSWSDIGFVTIVTVISLPSIVLGVVIARRVPSNPVGALLAGVGFVPCVLVGLYVYERAAIAEPGRVQLPAPVASLMQSGSWMWLYVSAALLVLYFPDGKLLPGRKWRFVMIALPVEAFLFTVLGAVSSYEPPFEHVHHAFGQIPHRYQVFGLLFLPPFLALLIASAVSIRIRYRSATSVVRAQLKWFVLAGATVPGTLFLGWVVWLLPVVGGTDVASIGLAGVFIGVAAATAVAMLRHELYDVDRAISATLTYSILTIGVLTFWTLASFGVALVLGGESTVAAAALAAVGAVSLAPVRRRIQARVDRRFYPVRQRALAAIDDLGSGRTQGSRGPSSSRRPCARRSTIRHWPSATCRRATPMSSTPPASRSRSIGRKPRACCSAGRRWGCCCPRGSIHPSCSASLPTPRRCSSRWSGSASSSVMRCATSSRAARDCCVRATRSDVASSTTCTTARSSGWCRWACRCGWPSVTCTTAHRPRRPARPVGRRARDGRRRAAPARPRAAADRASTTDSTRRSSHSRAGCRCRSTSTCGRESCRTSCSTTAYYVASEGIANAIKHSDADRLSLEVVRIDEGLRVRVADNGRGGAVVSAGSGLPGLTDRVAALGGSLVVHSPPGRGTVLEAVLPCGS